jgi:hypothetical protein
MRNHLIHYYEAKSGNVSKATVREEHKMQALVIVLNLIELPNDDSGNRRQSQVSGTPIINHVSLTKSKWSSEFFIIYIYCFEFSIYIYISTTQSK